MEPAHLDGADTMTDRCEPPEHLRGVDGWHWVQCGDAVFPAKWHHESRPGHEPLWGSLEYAVPARPQWAHSKWGWRYLGPAIPSAEVAAETARLMREAAPMAARMGLTITPDAEKMARIRHIPHKDKES